MINPSVNTNQTPSQKNYLDSCPSCMNSKWFAAALVLTGVVLAVLGGIGLFASPHLFTPLFAQAVGTIGQAGCITLFSVGFALFGIGTALLIISKMKKVQEQVETPPYTQITPLQITDQIQEDTSSLTEKLKAFLDTETLSQEQLVSLRALVNNEQVRELIPFSANQELQDTLHGLHEKIDEIDKELAKELLSLGDIVTPYPEVLAKILQFVPREEWSNLQCASKAYQQNMDQVKATN